MIGKKLHLPTYKSKKTTIVAPKINIKRRKGSSTVTKPKKHRNSTADKPRQRKIHTRKTPIAVLVVVASVFIILAISLSYMLFSGWRFGNEVYVNGQNAGIISDKKSFNAILKEVENLALAATNGDEPNLDVYLVPKLIHKSTITPEFTLRQNMLANCENMAEAFAIYINDALVCATFVESDAFAALNEVKQQYNVGSLTNIDFLDSIAVRREFVPQTQVLETKEATSALNGQSRHREIYTVSQPEELANIADRFAMSLSDLQEMNKNLGEIVDSGVKVNVLKTQDVIRVQTKHVEKYAQEIGYETITTEDPEIPKGLKTVTKPGKAGSATMTATVIRINGQEHERIQISEQITKQPETEHITVGTKEGVDIDISAIGWIWPLNGQITSPFGKRFTSSERHDGLDISGVPYGASIRAAVGGKVTLAEWNGNYGNCIRINSGGGYVELYAHLSEILVKEGQEIMQGQVIGKMGNTGRSTGPHLHFEVRKDNVPIDPIPLLPKK